MKEKSKFDFKKLLKTVFVNNIVYKLAAILLGFLLWLFLGYAGL